MDVLPSEDPVGCPLTEVVGRFMPRLSEFAFEPGLVAAVDQHAAAVCDALVPAPRRSEENFGEKPDHAVLDDAELAVPAGLGGAVPPGREVERSVLADYVLGFTDVLTESDWREPVGYDFAALRLTAVCWLVREYDLLAP